MSEAMTKETKQFMDNPLGCIWMWYMANNTNKKKEIEITMRHILFS